jgi:hypothetical protein
MGTTNNKQLISLNCACTATGRDRKGVMAPSPEGLGLNETILSYLQVEQHSHNRCHQCINAPVTWVRCTCDSLSG